MHMAWVKYVCGRLKSDYRYSNSVVYNNYPFPEKVSEKDKKSVETAAQKVLDTRAKHEGKSLADLYHPDTMPEDLLVAHKALDKAVDACYTAKPFKTDSQRIAFLFDRYAELTR